MKKTAGTVFLALCLVFLLGIGSTCLAETRTIIEPKAENFIYYIDNSGSMGFQYEKTNMNKSKAAQKLLLQINEELPALDVDFGVYTYGPYKEYLPVTGYNPQLVSDTLKSVPYDYPIFNRQTPMGSGLLSLDGSISGLKDRVAVIVVTDGESNLGPDPADVIKDMYSKYGNRICFHFISFAQKPSAGTTSSDEQVFVSRLAGINPCSVVAEARDLASTPIRDDFIKKVFYDIKTITVTPEPEPAPEPEPEEEVIVFSNINFDFDCALIKPEYRDILKEATGILKERPEHKVLIEGHTCNMGPATYNMGLSQRRAQSVADFLADQGVNRDRLETKGYGLEKPKFDNSTREGRSLNRRVELNLQ